MAEDPYLVSRLARAFTALMSGLTWPGSESDEGAAYRPFIATFDERRELDADAFREAARLRAQWWNVDLRDGSETLLELAAHYRTEAVNEEEYLVTAERYHALERAMRVTLEGPVRHVVVRADRRIWQFHKTRHYIIGRVPGGGLAGLVALSVET